MDFPLVMSCTHESNKITNETNKKSIIAITVIILVTVIAILAIGTSSMSSVLDIKAKNSHALDLPVKTGECEHDTTEGPIIQG
jgi:biotin transporter BioY